MEWLGLVLVGAVVVFWRLGREPSTAARPQAGPATEEQQPHERAASTARVGVAGAGAGLLEAEVLRRATDMNDPDGTFMDGYVAGRLTERAELGQDVGVDRDVSDDMGASYRWSSTGDDAWDGPEDETGAGADEDMSDDW